MVNNEEVFIAFEGKLDPLKIPDLTTALSNLGITSNVRTIENSVTDSEPTLEIYDGHFNPDLVSKIEDDNGYGHEVLDPHKFLPWSRKTGHIGTKAAGLAFQANRNLARYLYDEFPDGRNLTIRTLGFVCLIKADEVFNTMNTIERNPHIVAEAPNLGPKSLEALQEIARYLIIPDTPTEVN